MNKINLLALSVALALTGCGSGDAETDGTSQSVNSSTASSSPDAIIQSWSMGAVIAGMEVINTTTADNADLCGTGRSSTVVETEDFKVGFGQETTHYSDAELHKAARVIQEALNELIEHTHLSKTDDLNITASNKWVACYNDSATGNGGGGIRKFDFSPKTLDTSDSDFADGYILAKHELFHVIQSTLLNDEVAYNHLPRWFQEGSAELLAGRGTDDTIFATIKNFMAETSITPYAVTDYSKQMQIAASTNNRYENDIYAMYLASLKYLFSKGLTVNGLLDLTRASYSPLGYDDFSQFYAAMGSLENELTLPTTFDNLKNNVADYTEYVIEGGSAAYNYSAAYTDDIATDMTSIYVMPLGSSAYSDLLAKGFINSAQDAYSFSDGLDKLPDGTYAIFVGTASEEIYGPITQSITNGELGDIDFSGVGICTECTD